MVDFRCIAIETATIESGVAACNGDQIAMVRLNESRNTSRRLYHAIAEAMERVDLVIADIDCVACGCGPGSFTGVRVAAAAAQAISFAQNVPVCRVSSLAALAQAALRRGISMPVAACLDARMGEVYLGIYKRDATGKLVTVVEDSLAGPDDFRFAVGAGQMLLAGNGWGAYAELVANNSAFVAASDFDAWPDALAVIEIAREQFLSGDVVESFAALPNYLRNKVTY